ncbi:MAG TPA: hypothetical protein VGD78_16025 [Chthoniobacterales bacterium]
MDISSDRSFLEHVEDKVPYGSKAIGASRQQCPQKKDALSAPDAFAPVVALHQIEAKAQDAFETVARLCLENASLPNAHKAERWESLECAYLAVLAAAAKLSGTVARLIEQSREQGSRYAGRSGQTIPEQTHKGGQFER